MKVRTAFLTTVLLWGSAISPFVFASTVEVEDPAVESTSESASDDAHEPPPGNDGKKRFWLTDRP